MPRIPFFKGGRSTPIDNRETDTPSPARRPTTIQRMYQSPTPNRSVTPGTIILDTPPGSPYPFAPRVKVKDFAYVAQERPTPARPPRPRCPLFDTEEERARIEHSMGSLVKVGGLKRSHSRSTSCPISSLPSKMTQSNARSRASSHPLLADIPSTPPCAVTDPVTTVPTTPKTMPRAPYRTPEGKRRPAALKLHSSNLTPLKDLPITPTPIRITRTRVMLSSAKKQQVDDDHKEFVESISHGLEDKVFYTPIRSESADDLASIPFRLDRRISRSAGDLKNVGGPCHTGEVFERPHVSTPIPQRGTSVEATTDTFCSEPENSVSPPSTTPSASRSFENIPLPWSLVPSSSLDTAQLNVYLQSPESCIPSPRLLPSRILSTCLSESTRLTSELNRLKYKYAKLLNQRDQSAKDLQVAAKRNDLDSLLSLCQKLERQMARCDRVVRQMYVCNDQIRQIEGQMVEHRVGVWQLRNKKANEDGEGGEVEILRETGQYVGTQTRRPYLQIREYEQDRSSTISLDNLDDLTFPLPPIRTAGDSPFDPLPQRTLSPSPNLPSSVSSESEKRALTPADEDPANVAHSSWSAINHDGMNQDDNQTTQTHETTTSDYCPLSPNAILIYPPNHYRSASVPLISIPGSIDMPHTPYIDDRSERSSHWIEEGTRRAIPGRTTGFTSKPLRFAVKSKIGNGRCQSMILTRELRTEQKTQKRESELNTPDSILLSLATAKMWTRDM